MKLKQLACAATMGTCLCASAASWRPVPGASDIDVELGSMQLEHSRVMVWVRSPGRSPLVPELIAQGGRLARVSRTAMRTEFDCNQRTMRVLAANAYDSNGGAIFMASVPGPVQAVTGQDMGWTYDAVCEAARAERRL
jgi:hypothetical protein